MEDHPILGVVLFTIGTVLLGLAYNGSDAAMPQLSSVVLGHILAFNGVLLFVLGYRKLDRARARDAKSR
jgi:hypothetical protein